MANTICYSMFGGMTGKLSRNSGELYVLSSTCSSIGLTDADIAGVVTRAKSIEIKSSIPFQQMGLFQFLNKAPGFATKFNDFCMYFSTAMEGNGQASLRCGGESISRAERLWGTEIVGVAPTNHVLKLINKNSNGDKRFLVMATGILPERGGRTWLIRPAGFNDDFSGETTINIRPGKVWPDLTECWFAITNAVLFVSGHRTFQGVERAPSILEYELMGKVHDAALDTYFQALLKQETAMQDAVRVFGDTLKECVLSEDSNSVVVPTDVEGVMGEGAIDVDTLELDPDGIFCSMLWRLQ